MSERDELVMMAVAGKRAGGSGWVRGNCPFCEMLTGTVDRTLALGLNVNSGEWRCFRCHSRGLLQEQDGALLEDVVGVATPARVAAEPTVMGLPDGFVSIYGGEWHRAMPCVEARKYLQRRGVSDAVGHAAGIGAVFGGWLGGRVVVPIWEQDGKLAGWSARLWQPAPPDVPKYLYPRGMDRARTLYNAAALGQPGSARQGVWHPTPLFVVEGVFDALALWPDAIACLGKPSAQQLTRIALAARETKRPVVAMLDGDAWREARTLARELKRRGVEAASVRLDPKQDPGGTRGEVLRALGDAALGRPNQEVAR